MATNANKPAFDYAAHEEALDRLFNELRNHTWSFKCDSYFTLMAAIETETRLYKDAVRLGIMGVNIYNNAMEESIDVLKAKVRHKEQQEAETRQAKIIANLDRDRKRYMRPIDFFREDVEHFDWYYDFSDDIEVFRRGKAREQALKKQARESGQNFQAIWLAYMLNFQAGEGKKPFVLTDTPTDDLVRMVVEHYEVTLKTSFHVACYEHLN